MTFLFLAIVSMLGFGWYIFNNHSIDFSILERYDPGMPTILLDDQGKEWARFQLDRRDPVSFDIVPKHVIDAFLAAEDWQFFAHHGISYKGIIRSVFVNIYHGKKVQGASTITQQLVKLLFFDASKTFSRKIKEQLYALIVDQQFSKHQILETYLNHVYFGCGIYGVQAASQRFWGKDVQEISVDEAASLASIIKNPSHYCPLLCPLSNQKRRNLILSNMLTLGFIGEDTYHEHVTRPLIIKQPQGQIALHCKEYIRQFLEEQFGRQDLYSGGLVVQTTLSREMQQQAENIFKQHCIYLRKDLNKPIDGGMIAMQVATGGIKAMVGGFDFKASQFNRATQARRQMGSVFKPLLYATALERGLRFTDIEIDEPTEIMQDGVAWAPKNFDRKFHGPITRAFALSRSNNIVTVKTLLRMGIYPLIQAAQRCRLGGPFNPYPSLALGCLDSTVKETVGMFNIFANDGIYVEPHVLMWVKDTYGNKIYRSNSEKERIFPSDITSKVAKVLQLSLKRVKKWFESEWIDMEAISKSGTTNDSRTCWYAGSSPTVTTVVCLGCDDNRSLGKNVYPIRTAFPLWLAYNRAISSPIKTFSFDPSLREICINERTGKQEWYQTDESITIFA